MDPGCLKFCLTDQECDKFETDEYFTVKAVLPKDLIGSLDTAADRLNQANEPHAGGGPLEGRNHFDVIGKDDAFLELLDWPRTFPKVWGLLGWHIQLYHSQMIYTAPLPEGVSRRRNRLGWHQDSGRLNVDLEGDPRPRISLKVAYFLTDCSTPDCGNFHVIPGSHTWNNLEMPENSEADPPGALPVLASPGDTVFFDRRLWHAAGHNRSDHTRKVLFLGYSYRWLKPRDDMPVGHYMDRCDPIRQQLLGAGPTGGHGFTSPRPEDIPLRGWLRQHVGDSIIRE